MTVYLRVQDGVAVSTFELPEGAALADSVHPSVIDEFVLKGDADVGWIVGSVGKLLPPPEVAVDLAALKLVLKAAIDEAAERERLKYITSGAGQAMTYQAKVEEARRLTLSDPSSADPSEFPLLAAEVGITAPAIVGVAETVLAAYAQWLQIGAGIEAVRLGAKAAIEAAATVAEARAVTVVWPSA